ncbi:MAG: ATP-binding protein [Deltaproteobacteria bacterium]|nr:ATP-binding protein [Deltaproteobacteria bacterium]
MADIALKSPPSFVEAIRRIYLRGEASTFILYDNVFDRFLYQGGMHPLGDYLVDFLLKDTKDTIITYNLSAGMRFRKRHKEVKLDETVLLDKSPLTILPKLEDILNVHKKVGVVIDYADMVAPGGDPNFFSSDDRRAVVTMHRWSLSDTFERNDSIVLLVTESLSNLNQTLVSNPKMAAIRIPLPDEAERAEVVKFADPRVDAATAARFASLTAGLKGVQIAGILHGPPPGTQNLDERKHFIRELLAGTKDAEERADKLAQLTSGMGRDEIRKLVNPDARAPEVSTNVHFEEERLIAARKREILERECYGLIEFIESRHGFEVVGGMDGIKRELQAVARAITAGETNRVPMGMLFTGPMGTGKTFVAEAFAKESGLTAIKLKNFRSKWVGATEGNLEKVLSVVKALGQVLVIIDEGDRAFGGTEGEGDGGTSSRVIARLKEFMSDTSNRGRVLFVLMTNRPDKLDLDLKRAGRLDRKIPFLYSQVPEEVEGVLSAQLRRHKITHEVEFPRDRETVSARLVGYSNADVEALVLMANDRCADEKRPVRVTDMQKAIDDYMPPKDATMLEYMELLAVFEASNKALLPLKYQGIPVEELQQKLRLLRAQVR